MSASSQSERICSLSDIVPDSGICALVREQQIAIFLQNGRLYALDNRDPFSGANVLARGILGDVRGEPVVASPIFKQHFSLITGRCIEDEARSVAVHSVYERDGAVWIEISGSVRDRRESVREPRRPRLVVIGNGMSAVRTLETLLRIAAEHFSIAVIGAEPEGGYNRILLSSMLAGDCGEQEVVTHPPSWYAANNIALHAADPAVRIDRLRRAVHLSSGSIVTYDRLLIATGSAPVMLPVPGCDLAGVVSFRTLRDVSTMLVRARPGATAVVIGGGLLGLEAASGLCKRGFSVTVVHLADTLMERQLDVAAAGMLAAELAGRGVRCVLGARTRRIAGSSIVSGVELDDDTLLPADLVVMAVGVRPNTDLARSAGICCERGIMVDDTLMTFDPAIYAVGECAQHRGVTYGLVAPLWEQADVCASQLAEFGLHRYGGSTNATNLKVSGIDLFSAGDVSDIDSYESIVMSDPANGIYRRLVLDGKRMRAAVLYGAVEHAPWYRELLQDNAPVDHLRARLMFGRDAAAPA